LISKIAEKLGKQEGLKMASLPKDAGGAPYAPATKMYLLLSPVVH
jgi:hypothetical protein